MSAIIHIEPLQFPWQTQDPFLFCAYHNDHYPEGNGQLGPSTSLSGRSIGSDFSGKNGWSMYHGQRVPGFPAHPHAGFETVTIAEKGLVDHSDSLGAAGRFGEGDVQWMTAGGGVQHSEMFPLLKENEENPLLLFQIWLNLPKASKSVPAYFDMLWHENIPLIHKTDANGKKTTIKLICGELGDKKFYAPAPDSFAAQQENQVAIWLIHMEANATWELPTADVEANRSLYLYEGEKLNLGEETMGNLQVAKLKADQSLTLVNGDTPARMLFLQGKPIGEPVVQHGPFVANDQKEIHQLIQQYQRTQFGGWPWPSHEHTHDPEKGRFAKYADGKLVEK